MMTTVYNPVAYFVNICDVAIQILVLRPHGDYNGVVGVARVQE